MQSSYEKLQIPRTRKIIEDTYYSILAPFAVKTGIRDDMTEERENDNRGVFQRDRDRIIHSEAFRRLMYKTQVFVNHEGDHFRTRLTHTLEVAQLARGVCKSLALNEDLAEAIALGHDLGHTPFGHAVEIYFDKELGGFTHNEQSVRIVEFLEKRKEGVKGLNLSQEVREGILKHTDDTNGYFPLLNPKQKCSHLEGQIVKFVDTIAYICHDMEDAIKSGIVNRAYDQNKDFQEQFSIVKNEIEEVTQRNTGSSIKIEKDQYKDTFFIRNLIHFFIMDFTNSTCDSIKSNKIEKLDDVMKKAKEGIELPCFTAEVEDLFKKLKKFIYAYIYDSQTISMMDEKAVVVVSQMFEIFNSKPELLPPNWLYKYKHIDNSADSSGIGNNRIRVICDYISSMTDRFALDEHDRLFDPRIRL